MTQPKGRLYVDPDGVVSVGDSYDEHVQIYDTYLADLVSLRDRYANAWGDDDMGRQFSTKFLDGLDNLEGLIGGVRGTLVYTSEGLRSFGKAYEEADEGAKEAGRRIQGDFEESFTPRARHAVTAAEPAPPGEPAQQGELQPMRLARRAVVARAEPGEPAERLEPTRLTRQAVVARAEPAERLEPTRLTRQAVVARAEPAERLEPTRLTRQAVVARPDTGEAPGHVYAERRPALAPDEPVAPLEPRQTFTRSVRTPLMPATSSMIMMPDFAHARIGGEPLPEGYRLEALNPFPDGTARVDANRYDSITPLTGTPVTTADGRPIDPEGRQLFVVKDNPAADPTAPGYQPLVLSYAPDGTPTPLIPGDA